MGTFRQKVNDCVRIGLNDNISRMKKLGLVAYKQLGYHDIVSYYKLCAISHAAGILGNRKKSVIQLLHHVSKAVVQDAKDNGIAIILEDIRGIRRLCRRGNYQGKGYRSRMNSWSFAQTKRMIKYKASWKGIPVIQLSDAETKWSSQLCPRCGKITKVDRKTRQLWCGHCKKWMDRDVVAAMNLSIKGLARFASSRVCEPNLTRILGPKPLVSVPIGIWDL